MKKSLMIAVILRPVHQIGCEKVEKSQFVLFDFNFVTKKIGQRARFHVCY